jgi:hypothetical protein
MVLLDDFKALFDTIKGFFESIYTLLLTVYAEIKYYLDFLVNFISSLMGIFPFDDSRKSILLSILFFIMTIGIIYIFSSTGLKEGLSDSGQLIELSIDPKLAGSSHTNGGFKVDDTVENIQNTTKPPSLGAYDCYSDADCSGGFDTSEPYEGVCCIADIVGSEYACAGKCLISGLTDLTACKHPNACIYPDWGNPETFKIHLGDYAQTLCYDIDKIQTPSLIAESNKRCQSSGDTIDPYSVCCGAETGTYYTPCNGYCLKTGGSYDCDDYKACYEQLFIDVDLDSPGVLN